MKNISKRNRRRLLGFAGAIVLCGTFLVSAGPKEKELYWYDGTEKRKLYLRDDWAAEMDATQNVRESLSSTSGLRLVEARGKVRLYHVDSQKNGLMSLSRSKMALHPVFSDTAKGRQLRTLPGGVIVRFKNEMNETDVLKWAKDHNLTIKQKLALKDRPAWVFHTPAGLKSLDVANELHELPEVYSASPNWWVRREHR